MSETGVSRKILGKSVSQMLALEAAYQLHRERQVCNYSRW